MTFERPINSSSNAIDDREKNEDETSESKRNEYQNLVDIGIAARKRRDKTLWELGDLALTVETGYGQQTLEKYADDIGVPFSTLKNYRWVASMYEKANRLTNLSQTHYLAVAARDDRLDWLKRAEENNWSVRTLKDKLREHEEQENAGKQVEQYVEGRQVVFVTGDEGAVNWTTVPFELKPYTLEQLERIHKPKGRRSYYPFDDLNAHKAKSERISGPSITRNKVPSSSFGEASINGEVQACPFMYFAQWNADKLREFIGVEEIRAIHKHINIVDKQIEALQSHKEELQRLMRLPMNECD